MAEVIPLFSDGELADHPPVVIKRAFDAYNITAVAVGWPITANLTESRKKRIRVALKDCGGLAGWEMALARAAKSDLLTGKVKPRWGKAPKAEVKLDWFLWDKRRTSLLDGEYDNREAAPAAAGPSFQKRLAAAARPVREQVPFVLETTREQRMASTVILYRKHKRWADANRVECELAEIEGRPAVLVPDPAAKNPDVVTPRREQATGVKEQFATSRRESVTDVPPDYWDEIPEGDESLVEG